jgi:hypothetical protein
LKGKGGSTVLLLSLGYPCLLVLEAGSSAAPFSYVRGEKVPPWGGLAAACPKLCTLSKEDPSVLLHSSGMRLLHLIKTVGRCVFFPDRES